MLTALAVFLGLIIALLCATGGAVLALWIVYRLLIYAWIGR